MTNADGAEDEDVVGEPDFHVPSRPVVDRGKVTIPHNYRDEYGIGRDDVVHVGFATEDEAFFVHGLRVHESGQVTIPSRLRNLYEVEDGDRVYIEVWLTDMTMEQ